ncbi:MULTISPECIES: phage tail sheath family protein [Photorhabdus]|uniref:Phage tail sheath subtilisin-like domain-containing protein n=1 Tax=Photorhabdus bodei TaxID=2029681 RepID=A0AAW6BEZ0_9GAMM|nr:MULTISPECIES: phage tail sheath C-terminal domain-containing protein [Photorhabdus]MCC8465578.1 phage tail sheath family protein [Photorhabdus bodei]MCT8353816.1 phage tail sheath subtilisin-like domain-containing protein [Photorhabdus kayaii]MDB6370240.1 phage tail sheath subtilisin-like domain-containing protein [Photorhabdus bodei]MDB6371326.1 phage tail sheath subtilisin-like domain-containing protein [Photorhabdus bodei]
MTMSTTYPGVYIEEDASLALSVRTSATAVPIFAVADNNKFLSTDAHLRISGWLDYLTRKGEQFNPDDKLDISLRAYFINGGGYCYLVKIKDLVGQVPTLDDVTLLVAAGENITTAVAELCKPGKGLFAIFDGPDVDIAKEKEDGAPKPKHRNNTTNIKEPENILDSYPSTPYGAVYYPWLTAEWGKNKTLVDIPPSAVMAGIYASVDNNRGVWQAPANVAIQGGLQPKYPVTDDLQGQYNQGKALNMIRNFPKSGTLVWGARTLEDSDNWRYIPVRRLFNSAERDIKNAMSFAVFEPNSQPTWEAVRRAIDNYLYSLWQQGGLVGNKADQAYFVQIGKNITMTDDEIKQGKMIVKVGMAAVRPAEFIILQFTQSVAQ